MGKYKYIGCFVDKTELLSHLSQFERLSRIISHPHVTLQYQPQRVHTKYFGAKIRLKCLSCGNDGKNEGILVRILDAPAPLLRRFRQIKVPHITVSIADSAEPVNTKNLVFTPIPPFEFEGVYGGFCEDGLLKQTP